METMHVYTQLPVDNQPSQLVDTITVNTQLPLGSQPSYVLDTCQWIHSSLYATNPHIVDTYLSVGNEASSAVVILPLDT